MVDEQDAEDLSKMLGLDKEILAKQRSPVAANHNRNTNTNTNIQNESNPESSNNQSHEISHSDQSDPSRAFGAPHIPDMNTQSQRNTKRRSRSIKAIKSNH